MNLLVSLAANQSPDLAMALFGDLSHLSLPVTLPEKRPVTDEPTKGDPVTVASVFAIALGAGGALTAAMSKDGFFTQLARVLEKYVDQQVNLEIEQTSGQKLKVFGSAGEIRRLLKPLLEAHLKD